MDAGGQVEVGAAEVDDPLEQVVDVERRRGQRAGVALERLGGEGDAQRRLADGRFDRFEHRTSSFPLIGPVSGSS